jgi:phosphatidylserine decarboxylase
MRISLKIYLLLFIILSIIYYRLSLRNGDTTPMKTLLSALPHHAFSQFTGLAVSVPLPRFFRKPLFDWYINKYGVNLNDVSEDPYSFPCLGKFFVRDLKPGIRPIEGSLVSPVDGTLRSFGQISDGTVLEVKGQQYNVSELLGSESLSAQFTNGSFLNFYLAPGDYHHVHAPVTGVAVELSYVPGRLWPVNTWAWTNIPKLLIQNERVAAIFDTEFGRVAVVMIGALNVGSIKMIFPELASIQDKSASASSETGSSKMRGSKLNPVPVNAGERIGTFEMGSSVVVLVEKRVNFASQLKEEQKIKYGALIGL